MKSNQGNFLGALLSMMQAFRSPNNGKKGFSRRYRWDWRRGPTPKAESRRWRAMMGYRKSLEGEGIAPYENGTDGRAEILRIRREKGVSVEQAAAIYYKTVVA